MLRNRIKTLTEKFWFMKHVWQLASVWLKRVKFKLTIVAILKLFYFLA